MSSATESTPTREVDPTGRLLPIPADTLRRRAEHLRSLMSQLASEPDDPAEEARWQAAVQGVDELRCHRPLFRRTR